MARLQKVEDGSFFDTRVKSSKAVRACTIKLLNLGPAELRELPRSRAIRRYQVRGNFDPNIPYLIIPHFQAFFNAMAARYAVDHAI